MPKYLDLMERKMQMNNYVEWDKVPDVMSKETFYKVCHISKATALELIQTKKIPSKYIKKVHTYQIKKVDVMKYMEERMTYNDVYVKPYKKKRANLSYPNIIPDNVMEQLHEYYEDMFADVPDELKVLDVVDLIGYRRATIMDWCSKKLFEHARKYRKTNYIIPKEDIIKFLCSRRAQSIVSKSKWHIEAIYRFENGFKLKDNSCSIEELP